MSGIYGNERTSQSPPATSLHHLYQNLRLENFVLFQHNSQYYKEIQDLKAELQKEKEERQKQKEMYEKQISALSKVEKIIKCEAKDGTSDLESKHELNSELYGFVGHISMFLTKLTQLLDISDIEQEMHTPEQFFTLVYDIVAALKNESKSQVEDKKLEISSKNNSKAEKVSAKRPRSSSSEDAEDDVATEVQKFPVLTNLLQPRASKQQRLSLPVNPTIPENVLNTCFNPDVHQPTPYWNMTTVLSKPRNEDSFTGIQNKPLLRPAYSLQRQHRLDTPSGMGGPQIRFSYKSWDFNCL